jgi:hypothetical protein
MNRVSLKARLGVAENEAPATRAACGPRQASVGVYAKPARRHEAMLVDA